MWPTVVSQNRCAVITHSHRLLCNIANVQQEVESVVSPSEPPEPKVQPTLYSGNDAMWLSRTDHRKLLFLFLSGYLCLCVWHSPLQPSHHVVKKSRSSGEVMPQLRPRSTSSINCQPYEWVYRQAQIPGVGSSLLLIPVGPHMNYLCWTLPQCTDPWTK
jgi:hypothetical protein